MSGGPVPPYVPAAVNAVEGRCEECGAAFVRKVWYQRFCGKACRLRAWYRVQLEKA